MSRHSDPRTVAPSALEDGSLLRDSAVYDITAATAAALGTALGSVTTDHSGVSLPADFATQPLSAIWLHLEQHRVLDDTAKRELRQNILDALLESVELQQGSGSGSGSGTSGSGSSSGTGGGTPPHSIPLLEVAPQDIVACRGLDCVACRRQEPRIESVTPTSHVLIGSYAWHVQRWLRDEEQLYSFLTLEEGRPPGGGGFVERFVINGGRQARHATTWILSIARQ